MTIIRAPMNVAVLRPLILTIAQYWFLQIIGAVNSSRGRLIWSKMMSDEKHTEYQTIDGDNIKAVSSCIEDILNLMKRLRGYNELTIGVALVVLAERAKKALNIEDIKINETLDT